MRIELERHDGSAPSCYDLGVRRWWRVIVPGLVFQMAACTSTPRPEGSSPTPPQPRPEGSRSTPPRPPSAGTTARSASLELERALAAARSGDLETTIRASRAALEQDPRLEKAYLLLGSACALREDEACEAETYERGIEALPRSTALRRELGFFLLRQGRSEEAVAHLEKAREAETAANPELLADLAVAYTLAGRLPEAQKTAQEAVRLAPACVACHLATGEVALARRAYREAEQAFEAAAEHDPDNIEALRSRARAAFLSGDVDRAAALFSELSEKAPDHPRVQVQAAQVLMKAERPEQAVVCLRSAARLLPEEPRVLLLLAQAQEAAGDSAAAEVTRTRAASMNRKSQRTQPPPRPREPTPQP